jgi:hypothetical protein
VSGEPPEKEQDSVALALGWWAAILSPVVAASASLLCACAIGTEPFVWIVLFANGIVAVVGPMAGAMTIDDPLATRLVGAVLSGIGGLAFYCVILLCAGSL